MRRPRSLLALPGGVREPGVVHRRGNTPAGSVSNVRVDLDDGPATLIVEERVTHPVQRNRP